MCRKVAEQSGVLPFYVDYVTYQFYKILHKNSFELNFHRLVNDIIYNYCDLVKTHAMNGYSEPIRKIILYIHFHYEEDLNLIFFANMLYMNKCYLSTLFKKETNYNLTDYVHMVRMQRAVILLQQSAMSITTIATSCGYNSVNYFIRIFKRTYGISPKQYLKKLGDTEKKEI